MLGKTYEGENCSAARALELVGERWSLLIIRDALFRGVTRFSDFQRSLCVAPNILAARLDGFVGAGIMAQRRSPGKARQHEYLLTEKGSDLAPVVVALTAWGDRWAAPQGPPVVFVHAACGGAVRPEMRCTACGGQLDPIQVVAAPGPGARRTAP